MAELNNFKGFSVRYGAVSKDNVRLMTMYGCDGTNHAVWTATEYLPEDFLTNKNFVTFYAVDHGVKLTGKCTGTCKNRVKLGGFLGDDHPSIKKPM